MMKRKGIAYGVVTIIALMGVLGLAVWSAHQLIVGSKYESKYVELTKEDAALFKLELVKNFLKQDLVFSSRQAALDTAARGGTLRPSTYWYCPLKIDPPTPEEVNFALSDTTLNYLNAYVKTSQEKGKLKDISVEIPEYTCVGVYDPGEENCILSDSNECEYFWSSGTGDGNIEIEDPAYASDTEKIIDLIDMIRFYWIYYKLYEDTKANPVIDIIQSRVNEKCEEEDLETIVRLVLDEVCKSYEQIFDNYVSCSYEILCLNERSSSSCQNVQCRQPFTGEICYESPKEISKDKILFQGLSFQESGETIITSGSLKFKITLTDSKYMIPSSERELQPLVWNLWGVMEIEYPLECYVIIIPVNGGGGGGGGGPPQPPPPPPGPRA